MLFAVLELGDFLVLVPLLIFIVGGAVAMASTGRRPGESARLQRIEEKLDLILANLRVEYVPSPKTRWQELADDPANKIEAVKVYKDQHGCGLAEAKNAVEDYIAGRGK